MNIVFLDTDTISAQVDMSRLQQLGNVVTYSHTAPHQTAQRITDAHIVLTNKVFIGQSEMQAAPNLKLICVTATGYNNVDLQTANQLHIPVTNVRGYAAVSVAQMVMGYILYFTNRIHEYNNDVKSGAWQQSPVFTLQTYPIIELADKTIGIVGYGAIGERVAMLAKAFGMNVLVSQRPNSNDNRPDRVPLNELLQQSDVVSIHTPLTDTTRNLIDRDELALMKSSALLINTARGGVVNEQALHDALLDKRISGAATDVLSAEPPTMGNILIGLPNLVVTPHVAWASIESQQRLIDGVADNIAAFLQGNIHERQVNRW